MSVEEKLDELIKQMKSDQRQADKDRHENRMYICWGFALATLSLAVAHLNTSSTVISAIVAVVFLILGWIEWGRTHKPKQPL